MKQVFRLERETIPHATGEISAETVYGVTSLDRAAAPPDRLLRLIRHN